MKNASFSVNQQLAWRVILPCLAATLAFVGLAGATTIGTNIATDGSLTVTGTTTIDSGVFYVDPTNNRIGIGTIYPNSQLHVYADNGGMIEVSDGGSVRAVLAAEMNLNSATSSAYVGALVGDSFGIRTGGLDRIYVNQYGQVGIGTSTDTQGKPDSPAKLEIWGTPGDNLLNISSSSGESFLRIDPKGYVGIGTTAPGSRLDVNGDINIASGSALKFGGESVLRIVPAYNNIFIGSLSGNLTSGSLNTFVGDRAGEDNTSGWYNTFIGANAGRNNNGGMENAFIGQGSGYNSLSGSYNTIIGSGAGQDLISGYSNVFIGNRAGYTENGNKKLYISTFDGMEYYDLVYGDFGTGELRLGGTHASSSPLLTIAANGNVGIGITSPQAALDIYGNMIISTSSGYLNFGTSTGSGGYGLRDNNGILQFRNMGGSWTDFGTSTGSSYWQENAFNDIYFNHWVGIGTTAPSSRLDVNGDINISLDRGYKQNGITILTSSTTAGSLLVGTGAGANMTSGEWVTYIGYEAGYHSLALLGYNTFVGYRAGYATTDGFSNVFVGTTAGYDNTTGYSNTFIGDDAGHYNVSGFMNVFMGALAGYENRTGNGNILIGDNAGRFNASATNTVAIGHQAGYGAAGTYNQNNVLLGYKAGYGLTTGDNNILLGYQAGDNLTMGDNNILLGYNIDARSPDSANTLNIGNLIFGFGINGEGTDVSSGNIGIGTATPLAKLDVFGNFIISTSSGYLNFNTLSGESGYGFRDNGGVIQYKNMGGGWADLGGSTSSSYWLENGFGKIYYGGNVGIGTTTPTKKLEVSGETFLGGDVTLQSGATISNNSAGTVAIDQALKIVPIIASGPNDYLASLSGLASYASGTLFMVTFQAANTGACTLNINSLGAKQLWAGNNSQITTSRIQNNSVHLLLYDPSLSAGTGAFRVLTVSQN